MPVSTNHKSTQDSPSLDQAVIKSYFDKDQEIKNMENPKLCWTKVLNIKLDVFPECGNKQKSRLICFQVQNLLHVIAEGLRWVQITEFH